MTLSNAVKQRIVDLATGNQITIHKLDLNSGVPYSTLSSFLSGKCMSITLTTLLHICEGCNIELKDFFDDNLFKNISSDTQNHVSTRKK